MANTTFQTRIKLKFDTLENWNANKAVVLLNGEMGLCYVPAVTSGTTQTAPTVLFKVGDGEKTWEQLPWGAGVAADVYSWAKAPSKPAYSAAEIAGLEDFINNNGNTQYKLKKTQDDASGLIYTLYAVNAGEDGSPVETAVEVPIDLSRIVTLESDLAALKTRVGTAEETLAVGTQTSKTTAAFRTTWANAEAAIREDITDELGKLGTVTKTQNADDSNPLTLSVTTTNGIVSAVSGSIKADTFDAHGAAAAVLGAADDAATANTVYGAKAAAKAAQDDIDATQEALGKLALDFNAATPTANTLGFVGAISQAAGGQIGATAKVVKLTGDYSEDNPLATKDFVNTAVANLTGAMHFVGVVDTEPSGANPTGHNAGDIVIFNKTSSYQNEADETVSVTTPIEYVFDGTNWQQLGDEGHAAAYVNDKLSKLDYTAEGLDASKTLTAVAQSNGLVGVTAAPIQIAESQVTDLTAHLNAKAAQSDLEALDGRVDTLEGAETVTGSVAEKIKTAVGKLAKEDTAEAGKYVSAVSQANGIITVTRADLPTVPDLSYTAPTAEAPEADEVDAISTLSATGHTISATAYKVATKHGITTEINKLAGTANVTSTTDGSVNVLTGVTQTAGIIAKGTEVNLKKVAQTGKIDDLTQTNYVIFDCGTSTTVI